MAQQIDLFKIELCPEIKKIHVNFTIARPYLLHQVPAVPVPPINSDINDLRFRNECAHETCKADSFADDNTTGTVMEVASLTCLKLTLDEFASFSGLKCNVDKTTLMPIGRKEPIPADILALGFNKTDKIHILGMTIDSELADLGSNFEVTCQSINKCKTFWKRFNLSLAGRINVIKSLLFSQIIYLGCFLMPSQGQLRTLQNMLDEFALNTLNVARHRIPLPIEQGGLGLFNVEEFLTALQSKWIIKAHRSRRDNWRFMLAQLCNGNVLCAGPHTIRKTANPILHSIVKSYQRTRVNHDSLNCNFLHAHVINNPLFFRGPGNKLPLTLDYLELDEGSFSPIVNLKYIDFLMWRA